MASFILGTSVLGASTLGAEFKYKKYKVKIYNGTTWKTYCPVVINNLAVSTNAIVDVNGVPILDSNNEFLLVSENTEGLTAAYTYADGVKYAAYIYGANDGSTPVVVAKNVVYTQDGNKVYRGQDQLVYRRES